MASSCLRIGVFHEPKNKARGQEVASALAAWTKNASAGVLVPTTHGMPLLSDASRYAASSPSFEVRAEALRDPLARTRGWLKDTPPQAPTVMAYPPFVLQ